MPVRMSRAVKTFRSKLSSRGWCSSTAVAVECSFMITSILSNWSGQLIQSIGQVEQGQQEDPDQIHQVPVKSGVLQNALVFHGDGAILQTRHDHDHHGQAN